MAALLISITGLCAFGSWSAFAAMAYDISLWLAFSGFIVAALTLHILKQALIEELL